MVQRTRPRARAHWSGPTRAVLRLAASIALAVALVFGARPARAEPGDELTVTVLTFGPGDHPFYKFGHNAIWIHDAKARTDKVYNWGTFTFDSLAIIPKFFLGRFQYWLSAQGIRSTIGVYRRENRSIEAQELNLTAAQKKALQEKVEHNLRPENRYYKYDYYRDNCSTRVRDVLDEVTGGRLRAAAEGRPAEMTLRDHTLRLTADLLPEYLVLHIALGPAIDGPITRWEEAFLPEKVQSLLRDVKVPGEDGSLVPLVKSERTLLSAARPAPLSRPPSWLHWMLLVGASFGGALAAAGHFAARRSRLARVALGLGFAAQGLVLGFFGTGFVLVWLFTDHVVGYRNENILQCAPWSLALVVLGVGVARGGPRSIARAHAVVLAAAGASVLGLVLGALPWLRQANGEIIALMLPAWAGAAYGIHRLRATVTAPATEQKARAAQAGAEAKPAGASPDVARETEKEAGKDEATPALGTEGSAESGQQ